MIKQNIDVLEILKKLINFKTTEDNPKEIKDCLNYIKSLLESYGFRPIILHKLEEKPILYCKITGQIEKTILFHGHIDVVQANEESWNSEPFKAIIKDELIYGRGVLDMKGPLAMMITALIKLKSLNLKFYNSIILVITSDEETGGLYGAKYLVEEKKELFNNVVLGISEFGGFNLNIGQIKYYPIQVKQKQPGIFKASIRMDSKHTALMTDNIFQELNKVLTKITNFDPKPIIIPIVKNMFNQIASRQKGIIKIIFKLLTFPLFTKKILKLLNEQAEYFKPLFFNNINLTNISCIGPVYLIPERIEFLITHRLLPGFNRKIFLDSFEKYIGGSFKIEDFKGEDFDDEYNLKYFDKLRDLIISFEKDAHPIPILLPAATDARWFELIGIKTYGFTPIISNKNINLIGKIHSNNECIPLESLDVGAEVYIKLLKEEKFD